MANTLMDGEETLTNTFFSTQNFACQTKIVQVSVKCPQFYKDSVARDIIDCYCPIENEKAVIICPTSQKTQNLYNSEYLRSISILINNGLDRRERIKNARVFQQKNSRRCLITNNFAGTHIKNLKVKLIIFISPPLNDWIYNETLEFAGMIDYVAMCYSTKEIKAMCNLEIRLHRKFIMLAPPEVSSDEEVQIEQSEQSNRTKIGKPEGLQNYRIVVKNIHPQDNWTDLKRFLLQNRVQTNDVRVILMKKPMREDERKKKAGFVTCKDKLSFENALDLDGVEFHGRVLNIVVKKQRV